MRSFINQLISEKWLGLWLVLPVILLLPGITGFAYPGSGAPFSDMSLAHFPYALLQKTALLNEHRLRLWSPLFLSGAPLAGNPLAGMWYPPGWLTWILPLPLGFNLLIVLHLLWGGWGMYRLLRLENLDHRPALFGSLAFMMMPKIFAHYGAGHVSLVYAVSWTPWLLYAAHRRLTVPQSRVSGVLEALTFALICLSDIRWAVYAGLAWWLFSLLALHPPDTRFSAYFSRTFFHLLKQSFLAALLSAVLWIPMLEFSRLSTRSHLSLQDNLAYSLPLSRLIGLVFPDLGGFHEWMLYSGVIVFILSLLSVSLLWSQRMVRFWFGLWLAATIFALGDQIPGLHLLVRLPGFSLMRVPPRVMFLGGLALAALGAHAVQFLPERLPNGTFKRRNGILLGLCSFMLVFAIGLWLVTQKRPDEFLWGMVLALCGSLWISLKGRLALNSHLWFLGLLGLCLLDWVVMDRSLFIMRPRTGVFAEGADLAEQLGALPGDFRTYSPSYSLPQQTAANFDLQLADGIDPLQLSNYVEFMQEASGVPSKGYSVTLPPYHDGNPQVDNAAHVPNASMLGLLNVRYIAAEFDLFADGLTLIDQIGETRLYENQYFLPRAWRQPAGSQIGREVTPVEIVRWSPERIEIAAEGPGLLVLSEVNYPGWGVMVDGKRGELEELDPPLRSVFLSEGSHQVIFSFQPLSLFLGTVSTLTGLGLVILTWRHGKNSYAG